MIQSRQVLEWQKQALDAGLVLERQDTVLDLLRLRFSAFPAEVETQVRSQHDRDLLKRWFALAALAASLEQFRQQTGL